MLNDVPQKFLVLFGSTQLDSGLCKFASLHLIMQNLGNFPAIEDNAALSFALTHCTLCMLNSGFLTRFHAVLLS